MKRWIANLNIKQKVLVMLTLPMIVIVCLLFTFVKESSNLGQLEGLSKQELVALQSLEQHIADEAKESAFYLQNGDKKDLLNVRREVNQAIENLNLIDHQLFDDKNLLESIRDRIDEKDLSITDVLTEYEDVLQQLTPETSNPLSIPYLLTTKELNAAILEDVLLSTAFQENILSPKEYNALIILAHKQKAYQDTADALAPIDLDSQNWTDQRANKLRDLVIEKAEKKDFDVSATDWQQAQLERIQSLEDKSRLLLEQIPNSAQWRVYITVLLTILFLGLSYYILNVNINDSIQALKKISTAMRRLSEGDLRTPYEPSGRKDEVGQIEKEVYNMRDSLRKLIKDHYEEIEFLQNSIERVTTSITEFSHGNANTATSLTETSSAAEELKHTAQASADIAKEVEKKSDTTINTLKDSESAHGATAELMDKIQEKMTTIWDSIIKLSENSQVIGQIIDTVNDLAEQSNLLAVNAAIEAAKAGDQGKGFAVVAQEVRSLAEQSKQATVRVHNILNDIQNATSSAVMATEQGANAVTKGVAQSEETSKRIRALTTDIENVHQSATQIAASSQMQRVGIDQITVAMSNINEANNSHQKHIGEIKTILTGLDSIGGSLKSMFKL